MTQPAITGQGTTRRAVVTAAGAAGLAATLAACGKDDGGGSDSGNAGSVQDAGSAQPSQDAGSAQPSQSAGSAQPGGGDGMELAKTSQIPEGGGVVFKGHKVVVTQPTAGEFKAFSSICTHQGCSVGDVSGGTINCPCHQSKFDITDGSVKGGPARKPLPGARITVEGSSIRMA